ncbi:MAG TPA: SCP2 sterol-binding domain-containing protein [Actinomycetota bacterium]|nr:SCP2 sterol-binding domain-containing protein [Actinomycetota bacterium]
MADAQLPDPAQLAELVKGMSDEDLKAQLDQLGNDVVLKEIFDRMPEAFLPDKAKGVTAVMQYDIATDGGVKQWTVTVDNGTCTTSEGPADGPRLTLALGIVDFVRLIFGQAEGPQLFMGGKLKLSGDMMFAMQMQSYFDRNFQAGG